MQDPEIVFLVVDNRGEDNGNMGLLGVWPQMFQQAGIFARYDEIIKIENNEVKSFIPSLLNEVLSFCSIWFRNLRHQQNIIPTKANKAPENEFKAYIRKADKAAQTLGFKTALEAMQAGKETESKKLLGE